MAKKRLADIVGQESERQAEPKAPADAQDLGRTVSVGVGLKEGEVAELDAIVKRLEDDKPNPPWPALPGASEPTT